MLKARITEQYGLKVPFINAGMGFHCYRAPRAGGVQGGRNGNVGHCCNASRRTAGGAPRDQAAGPACFGVNFIARFSGIEHIEVHAALGEVLRWV
jgi:enoyl-[acyl-carrier protein] reductase II